jgi:hypothetical protein
MRFLNRTAPVRRILGGLLAMTLAFTNLGSVFAGGGESEVPVEATAVPIAPVRYRNHPVGIINASFGLNTSCLLEGWQTQGWVKTFAINDGTGHCKAVLSANRSTPGMAPGLTTATLEQTFVVNAANPHFGLVSNLTTNKANQLFSAQTVTIYGPSGTVIAHYAYNSTTYASALSFDLSAYGGQSVRLKFSATVDTRLAESPQDVSMEVIFPLTVRPPDPEPPPGGGS